MWMYATRHGWVADFRKRLWAVYHDTTLCHMSEWSA
jgi:hypothetical protein